MQDYLFELEQPAEAQSGSWFRKILNSLNIEHTPGWPDKFGPAVKNWLTLNNHVGIKTLSLFSGGGGLDIAFHDCGFDIVQMVEVESKYAETLKANSAPGKLFEGATVQNVDIRDYKPDIGMDVDYIIGGPPCQTFSAAGRRAAGVLGTDDPRGTLFEEYVRLLKALKPKGFLFENVYGITGAQAGTAWRQIQQEFKAAGYTIYHRILDAADYGVPQHRERLFIVGLKEGEFKFPFPTHGPDSIGKELYYTAGKAVATADKSGAVLGLRGRYGALLPDIPPGLNYSFYTKEMGHPRPVFSWRSKFSDFLYKADPNMPVRTVKAQGGQYTGPFSWENRPFTTAELKRLQTFPDNYEIIGGRQVCIEQIGNSVPPQIGRMLALSILNQVMGVSLPFEMHYLPPSKQLYFRQRKRMLTKLYADKAKSAINLLYPEGQTVPPIQATESDGELIRFLSPDFSFGAARVPGTIGLKIKQSLSEHMWEIAAGLEGAQDNSTQYEILISPTKKNDWCLGSREVVLRATSLSGSVFTGLWKAFEERLEEVYKIADLVQLSGYYQYRPKINARIFFSSGVDVEEFWWIVQQTVQGTGVGTKLSVRSLVDLWGIHADDLLSHLKSLRNIGYEVRSHFTNRQIPIGEYLVPYAFPTLSHKSVQLRKQLDQHYERRTAPESF